MCQRQSKTVRAYTNGGVLIKQEKAGVLRHHKVVFSITDYGDLSKSRQGRKVSY